MRNGARPTSVSPLKNHWASGVMSSSGVAILPSSDIDMSAISLVMVELLSGRLRLRRTRSRRGPEEHRPPGHDRPAGWPIVRQDAAVTMATFLAAGELTAFPSVADALAAGRRPASADPGARLAVHTGDARRARRLRDVGQSRPDARLRGGRRRRARGRRRSPTWACTACATCRRRCACSPLGDATPPALARRHPEQPPEPADDVRRARGRSSPSCTCASRGRGC